MVPAIGGYGVTVTVESPWAAAGTVTGLGNSSDLFSQPGPSLLFEERGPPVTFPTCPRDWLARWAGIEERITSRLLVCCYFTSH